MNKEDITNIILSDMDDADVKFIGDSCNLKVSISSKYFNNMNIIQQHRKVLNLLKDNFESGELHALSLETKIK
ncbi:BolA family transcriptional regulator [Gammaproteobacteria bacterium]|jgi:stress-induced morphogen|nr:BolA family transcriptional regulator [Gammaproteobacteria bacterium]MDA9997697.1 BolA family transcriptional regulator [Gammaproteobacteria bacterium]MDC0367381.1 BolA family transcriptional regulator [Gammaproteobacteria bacterium]MDC3248564.1 BolA family transcriptional regulator [Gammaproteobacteria bacterium]MDC3301895.1 BolA family transcriptional regulator [Gammaproteobacteria bacterium]